MDSTYEWDGLHIRENVVTVNDVVGITAGVYPNVPGVDVRVKDAANVIGKI